MVTLSKRFSASESRLHRFTGGSHLVHCLAHETHPIHSNSSYNRYGKWDLAKAEHEGAPFLTQGSHTGQGREMP